ncbi:MAG: hypothetical protein Q4A76_11095, partial [Porphyromonadaceae bacterium]|nr:hypothetical protein [Porphyromonadaceae bacterium]
DEIVDNQDEIIRILMDDTIWTNLINETPGYELEWKANSPSLWLNRNLYQTLKLVRNNGENILDAFIGNPNIHFDTQDSNRYLQIRGVNYYYAIPIFFNYRYNEKEYHFAWQTWGWIDMYDRDIRLYDLYIEKFGEGFSIEIDKLANHDSSYYIGEIEKCIDRYEKFIAEHKGI